VTDALIAQSFHVEGPISGTDKSLSFETGKLAPQSQGAVLAAIGDTLVLATANAANSVLPARNNLFGYLGTLLAAAVAVIAGLIALRRRTESPPQPIRETEPAVAAPVAAAATSAAWRLAGLSPPSSAAISVAPIRAASSTWRLRVRVTAALPAAVTAPQPCASKPAAATCSPWSAIAKRI